MNRTVMEPIVPETSPASGRMSLILHEWDGECSGGEGWLYDDYLHASDIPRPK